jgi:hypothetical protein
LTLDEHEQARCDLVRVGDEKIAGGANDAPIRELVDHGGAPRLSEHVSVWEGERSGESERIKNAGMNVK